MVKPTTTSVSFLTATILVLAITKSNAFSLLTSPNSTTSPPTREQREQVIHQYFDGVNKKDYNQIKNCFADKASITDICSLNSTKRLVDSTTLAERCKDFLTAHPDTVVQFHYPPTYCGRGEDNHWVIAHWYETGTWKGDSRGIKATGKPMEVEGQTRFLVNDELKITELVVTRTFTEWEDTLQKQSL